MPRFPSQLIALPATDPTVAPSVGSELLIRKVAGQGPEVSFDGGPWQFLATGSSGAAAIVVPTIADLEAYPVDGLANGNRASVQTLRDSWTLSPTVGVAADGITVVQAADGVRWWVRDQVPNGFWTQQTEWYVDPANGNDELRGITPGSALASVDEIRRRLGQLPIGTTYIYLLGEVGELVLDFNCNHSGGFVTAAVVVVGVVTVEATAAVVTATPHDNGAEVFGSTLFGADQSAQVGRQMRVADGAAAGAISWALDTTDGNTSSIDTGPFHDPVSTNEVFPDDGDTIEFCTLTQVSSVVVKPGCWASMVDCQITGQCVQEAGGTLTCNRSRVDGRVTYHATSWFSFLQGAYISPTGTIDSDAGRVSALTAWCRGRILCKNGAWLNVQGNSTLSLYGRTAADAALVFDAAERNGAGVIACYRFGANANCVSVLGGAHVAIGDIWGRAIVAGGAGYVLAVRSGAMIVYPAANVPDFAPNEDIIVGGAAGTISATLPTITAANNAAIVVDA